MDKFATIVYYNSETEIDGMLFEIHTKNDMKDILKAKFQALKNGAWWIDVYTH